MKRTKSAFLLLPNFVVVMNKYILHAEQSAHADQAGSDVYVCARVNACMIIVVREKSL